MADEDDVVQINLTDWIRWEDRHTAPSLPGLYVIARSEPSNVIYIGRTWSSGGLRERLRAFHRSSQSGLKGHAGGVTFRGRFGPETGPLFVRYHVPHSINPKPEILRPFLEYAERQLIWEHVVRHGQLPECNSE